MNRWIRLALASVLLAGWVWAGPQAPPKKEALLCTLTNQKIEKCCCEMRGEKLYCPLAKKTIDTCCCQPLAKDKSKKPQ